MDAAETNPPKQGNFSTAPTPGVVAQNHWDFCSQLAMDHPKGIFFRDTMKN